MATERLCNEPDCQALFGSYGKDGADIIASTTYLDGSGTTECSSFDSWTRLNSMTVYICPGFEQRSDQNAAVLLIHEALHSSGMGHDEYDNDELNQLIRLHCGLGS